jgi:cystathionine gamma-synthase
VRVDFVDPSRLEEVEAHVTPATRLIWIETPCNPTLKVTDIAAVAALAHEQGALLACDNTFATPIVQRPLELGADFVMHSSTKYFGGHSDVMGGAVIVRDSSPLATRIRTYQEIGGGVPSPFDCWLIRRSLATLPLRMRAQCANALEIARFLEQHRQVEQVFYPGLTSDPGHAVAAKQMRGFGAVVSVGVQGGATQAISVAARVRLFTRATSFGGVESLIEHRASVEGPESLTPVNLLRLSIGIEDAQDLIADLEQALRPA